MPIGKIVKISDKLRVCCIESINESSEESWYTLNIRNEDFILKQTG